MKAMAQLRMCPHCRAFVPSQQRVCPYCETEMGPRAVDRREPARIVAERLPHARFTTTIILLVNFGLYAALTLATMRAGNADPWSIDGRTLFQFGAKYRDAIVLGQWWRLVTAGFLHGGLFHILMNSWVLFDLEKDPFELHNLAEDPASAELRREMDARLAEWMRRTGDSWNYNWTEPVEEGGRLYRHRVFYTVDEYLKWAASQKAR